MMYSNPLLIVQAIYPL